MKNTNGLLTLVLLFLGYQLWAQPSYTKTWRGIDKYGLEQNTLILHKDGFYKFYEESVVLLDDSLSVHPELGLYRQYNNHLELLPLTGKTAYRSYNYEITNQQDSTWQLKDYEKGNSGTYQLVMDSIGITTAEMDFFKGIPYQQQLLQTTWQTEGGEEQWQFVAPDYVIIKKDGVLETTARVIFTEKLLTFINPQTNKVIFRAEIGSLTNDLLSIRDLRDGRSVILKSIDYQGLTARELGFYKNYLTVLYKMEIAELTTLLEWGKDRVKILGEG